MGKVTGWLHKIFRQDIQIKLASLVLAIIVWFHGQAAISIHVTELMPLEIAGTSPHLMTLLQVEEARVTLSGPNEAITRFLLKLKQGSYPISKISLPKDQDQKEMILPTRDFFDLPEEITLVAASPEKIKISVIRSQSKLLEIQPKIVGEAENEFRLVEYKSTPSLILVKGPTFILSKRRSLETRLIHLPPLERQGTLNIPIKLDNTLEDYPIEFKTSREIMVHIQISKKKHPLVTDVPVSLQIMTPFKESYSKLEVLSEIPTEVEVRQYLGERVRPIERVDLYLDLTQLKKLQGDIYECPLKTLTPEYVEILENLPRKAQVKMTP